MRRGQVASAAAVPIRVASDGATRAGTVPHSVSSEGPGGCHGALRRPRRLLRAGRARCQPE